MFQADGDESTQIPDLLLPTLTREETEFMHTPV